jgi:hypothetical protein
LTPARAPRDSDTIPRPSGWVPRRYRFVFSDDLVLERMDNKKPGRTFRDPPQNLLAGTHSGFAQGVLDPRSANDCGTELHGPRVCQGEVAGPTPPSFTMWTKPVPS